MSKKSLIIGGLVVVAILVGFTTVPNVIGGASPLLLFFVLCPLMMLLMMGGMNKGIDHNNKQPPHSGHNPYGVLPSQASLSREEQLNELKAQSSNLQVQREALTRQIDQLEGSPVVREAESIARAADEQAKD